MLVLVCVAAVVGVLDLLAQGTVPSWSAVAASWSWVLGVILVILAIIIVLWVVRLTLRAAGVAPREDRRERRRRRWEAAPSAPDSDPAVEIARERYARGEISQDDLNRILRQLGKGS